MNGNISPQLKIVEPADCPAAWDEYVNAHPHGSVFHLAGMFRVYDETPNHLPFGKAAMNASGKIVAMLPAVCVSTLSGPASRFASRSIFYAEPLCDDTVQGRTALEKLICHHDACVGKQTLLAEVRRLHSPDSATTVLNKLGYQHQHFLNYLVDTAVDLSDLRQGLSKSCRKQLKRAERLGVEVVVDNTHAGIERMYPLVVESYQRSRIPLADIQLFHAALRHLPKDIVQVRIATYQGEDVAAGIGLFSHGRFFAWYGGTRRFSNVAPFYCLTWDEIQWTCQQGGRCYDFGGAGSPDVDYGPRKFKAKFGGELVDYGRTTKVYSALRLQLAKSTFNMVRGLLTR